MDDKRSYDMKKLSHQEWLAKIHEASKTHKIDEDQKEEKQMESKDHTATIQFDKKIIIFSIFFFFLAFIPRFIFIFFVSNPDNPGAGWFGDAYHHWQIAYLTKEIGLSQGFLRLWDLKGMEYFWGLLHPLIIMLGFVVTGSTTIGVERVFTAIFGSISVSLLFLILKRFWGTPVAIAGAIFAALNPVGVFNDGTGMVEPLGIPFLLLGILLWPSNPVLVGLSFVLALMARAEYWVFSFGLITLMIFLTQKVSSDKKTILAISFIVGVGAYMKYLLSYTSNPIYPFYYNYLANIYGTWQLKQVLTPEDIAAKYLFLGIFILSVLLSLAVLWFRPKGMFFYLLGLGNWLFLGATFGLGAYIKSYMSYVWYVRFMILPYMFLGAVLAIVLMYYLKQHKYLKVFDTVKLNWLMFVGILAISQLIWIPIWNKYSRTEPNWQGAIRLANEIGKEYKKGGLLLMDGNPEITYALVRNNGVQGKDIVGQMFDPYFYFEDDPYKDWGRKRKIVLRWLVKNNIRTVATYVQYERYKKLAEKEPQFIEVGKMIPASNIIIYQVKDELYKEKI